MSSWAAQGRRRIPTGGGKCQRGAAPDPGHVTLASGRERACILPSPLGRGAGVEGSPRQRADGRPPLTPYPSRGERDFNPSSVALRSRPGLASARVAADPGTGRPPDHPARGEKRTAGMEAGNTARRQGRRSSAIGTTPTDFPESMSAWMTSRTSSRSRPWCSTRSSVSRTMASMSCISFNRL